MWEQCYEFVANARVNYLSSKKKRKEIRVQYSWECEDSVLIRRHSQILR